MASSGLSATRLLRDHGATVTATDNRPLGEIPEARARLAEWEVPFVPQSAVAFEDKDLIVLSPGVPADLDFLTAARRRGAG